MPPTLKVIPTDFAHYYSDGTGRDSYISQNNGGMVPMGERRFELELRGGTHRPERIILLPSYHTVTAAPSNGTGASGAAITRGLGTMGAEMAAAASRTDPRLRAARQHQRRVAGYMATARGSANNMGRTERNRIQAQHAAQMSGTAVRRGSYDPTLSKPQTTFVADSFTRSTHDYRAKTVPNVSGSFSARLPQRPVNPPHLGRSWDSATMRRQLQPLAAAPARPPPSNFAHTMPVALPVQPAWTEPGPFQQTLNDFTSSALLQQQEQQLLQQQQQQQQQSPPTRFARLAQASSSPSQTAAPAAAAAAPSDFNATRTLQQQLREEYVANRYVPTSPPSYHTTLPKHSSYLGSADTHRRLPNYNDLPPAGFSMSAKLRSRGIEEHPIPMLG